MWKVSDGDFTPIFLARYFHVWLVVEWHEYGLIDQYVFIRLGATTAKV